MGVSVRKRTAPVALILGRAAVLPPPLSTVPSPSPPVARSLVPSVFLAPSSRPPARPPPRILSALLSHCSPRARPVRLRCLLTCPPLRCCLLSPPCVPPLSLPYYHVPLPFYSCILRSVPSPRPHYARASMLLHYPGLSPLPYHSGPHTLPHVLFRPACALRPTRLTPCCSPLRHHSLQLPNGIYHFVCYLPCLLSPHPLVSVIATKVNNPQSRRPSVC